MMKQKTVLIIVGLLVMAAGGLRLKTFFTDAPATATIKDQTITVDIAATPAARARGLGGRLELPANSGMVFIFDKSERHNFWMKDMFFPIDIIWIDGGQVVDITENVPPPALGQLKLPLYSPANPANIVLEANAGFAAKYNIRVGDPFFIKY